MGVAALPLLATALSAGASAYNSNKTAKRQDNQAAEAIRNQSKKQQQADARVNEEVTKLQGSDSSDEKSKRMADYSEMLRRNKASQAGGFTQAGGSQAFRDDSAAASAAVQQGGLDTAGLFARMDAPGMQRQGEAFGYGHLATDLDMTKRESQGQAFIDDLRYRAIRRNPWIDMGAGLLSAGGGALAGRMGGGGTNSSFGPYSGGYQSAFDGAGGFIPQKRTSYGVNLPNFGD